MGTQRDESMKTSPNNGIVTVDQTPPPLWFSKRFFVAVVLFLCLTNIGIILTNMNIAIVEMTSNKTIVERNRTVFQPAEFQWDPSVVGLISSVISYGGLFSLAGGVFVTKLGGSASCAFFLMLCGIATIVQPIVLYHSLSSFIVLRLLTGFFANGFCVAVAQVASRWFPKQERSTLMSFSGNGMNVGVTIVNPICGYIADRFGWQKVFYVTGTTSLVVALLCLAFIKNRPTQDHTISSEELAYILDGTRESSRKRAHVSHQYKKMLLSPPVWALCAAEFVAFWVMTTTGVCLPLYAKDLIGGSTDEIGVISAIPMVTAIVGYPLGGRLMDYWRHHSIMKQTQMDKLLIFCVFSSVAVLLAACAVASYFTVSIIIFIFISIPLSVVPAVYEPNIINIAPNDASIMAGLAQISSSAGCIISRTIIGYITMNHTSQEWNNCFILSACVAFLGAVIYVKYGSSDAQPWSLPSDTKDEYDYLIPAKNGHTNGISKK